VAKQPTVSESMMLFAQTIHDYAASRGWGADDYRLFMFYKPDWVTLRIVVLAHAFEARSSDQVHDDFDDVMDLFDAALESRGHALNFFTLDLKGLSDLPAYRPHPELESDEVEVDEATINQGRVRSATGPSPATTP